MSKPKEIVKSAMDGKLLTKEEKSIVASNAQCSKIYAEKVLQERFIEGEEVIKTSASQTYLYAKDVIKGRWKEGEDTLSKDAHYAVKYAANVLFGRFPKGENEIAKNPKAAYQYAVARSARFEKAEQKMIEELPAMDLVEYSLSIIGGRWPEAEEKILKSSRSESSVYSPSTSSYSSPACHYACGHEFKWKEAESEILKNPVESSEYAIHALQGRWEEGEEIISTCGSSSLNYALYLEQAFEKGEDAIINLIVEENSWSSNHLINNYVGRVLHGKRWLKFESFIDKANIDDEQLIPIIQYYSDNVNAKLPDFIHNRMIAAAISNPEDWGIRKYFDSLEEREDNEKLILVKRFSLDQLREILSSVND